jgi:uncharacterized protein YgbK (DUF1537 family)
MKAPAILADDLTGALDTAAQFTGRWGPIAVHVGVAEWPLVPPCAVSSETRDLTSAEAVPRALAAASSITGGVTFLKIDSLLRGPWAAELAALHRAGNFAVCILAPAFPAQGRLTRGGWQIVNEAPAIDIAARLETDGLRTGFAVRIADAESDADLVALVSRFGPERPLWCGSAGLARALAGTTPLRPVLAPTPTMAVLGSDHPVTRRQMEALARLDRSVLRWLPPGEGEMPDGDWKGITALSFDLPVGTARAKAAGIIASDLLRLPDRVPKPERLVVTGGATLAALLVALGARRMLCLGELAPGLPLSRIEDGVWSGVEVLSKSGAFGGPDLLVQLCVDPGAIVALKDFDVI